MKVIGETNNVQKLGVWLSYRIANTDNIRRFFMHGAQANRILRKLNKKAREAHVDLSTGTIRTHGTPDFFYVEGTYIPKDQKRNVFIRKGTEPAEQRKDRYATAYAWREEQPLRRRSFSAFQHMSFHAGQTENAVLIFCPVTGICGKLEMPALPVALVHTHPLSVPGNALAVLKAYFSAIKPTQLDTQTLAGCVLSLLRGKRALQTDDTNSAAERNLVLQSAGNGNLEALLRAIVRFWDNDLVWKRMPQLSAEWRTHALSDPVVGQHGQTNMGQVVQEYARIMYATLDKQGLTPEESARIFAAQAARRAQIHTRHGTIKIHSASAVQAVAIKESKHTAREIMDALAPHLPIVLRTRVNKLLRELLISTEEQRSGVAFALKTAGLASIQQELANQLATTLMQSKNDRVFDELGSFSSEVAPKPAKSIAEILEEKRYRASLKQQSQEDSTNG